MQDRFPRVRKIPIRIRNISSPSPPPGRILRNFTRDTDTFVACQLNFPEKLISISRKVGSSTIRPIFGKIIRSDRNRVEIKHLSNIAINRVFRGGEYRHPRASGANTCPDLCIIPKESIPKMPIKVVKGGGKKSKRRIFCLTTHEASFFNFRARSFQRNRWPITGGGGTFFFFFGRKNTAITDNAVDNNRVIIYRRRINRFAK